MIRSMLSRAFIGILASIITAFFVWLFLLLMEQGFARTEELVKAMGPVINEGKISTPWFLKTGALPGSILGLIGAPYLGPIVGGYLWRSWESIAGPAPGLDFNTVGSVIIGVVAGLIGYLLRLA